MATIQASGFADVVASTLRELGRLKIENIAQNRTDYYAMPVWMKKGRMVIGEGYEIQRNLYNEVSGNAEHVGLMDEDVVNIPDLIKQLQVPWRHAKSHWAVHRITDTLMNRGASKIVDLIKLKREDAALSLCEEIENKAWGDAPAVANTVDPYSVKYWIVTNATTGFNGGLPSDHTTVGGVDLSASPHFYNYTAQYTTVNKPDLLKTMRSAARKTKFMSPIELPEYAGQIRETYKVYTNDSVLSDIEDVGEAQNENLGKDVASMNGAEMTFRRWPWCYVPILDDSSNNPVYFINHATFKVVMLKGNIFHETRSTAPHQHNIEQYFTEVSYNYVNVNRRRNAVFSTS